MASWTAQLRSTLGLGHALPIFPTQRSAILINVDRHDRLDERYEVPCGDVHLFRIAAALGGFSRTICGDKPRGIEMLSADTDTYLKEQIGVRPLKDRTRSWIFCNNQFSAERFTRALEEITKRATRRHLTFVYIHAPHMMTPYGFIAQNSFMKYEDLFAHFDTLPGKKIMTVCSPQGTVFLHMVSHLATAGAYAALVPTKGVLERHIYHDFRTKLEEALAVRQWIGTMDFARRFAPFNARL